MAPQLQLSVAATDATDDEIAEIARELTTWIGDAAPECAVVQETATGPRENKGVVEILGTLGVALLQPGALKSLIDCLAVFIKERRREVCITLRTNSGGSITLKAGGVGARDLGGLLEQLRQMMGGDRAVRT
jgi:hypothetical protein